MSQGTPVELWVVAIAKVCVAGSTSRVYMRPQLNRQSKAQFSRYQLDDECSKIQGSTSGSSKVCVWL